MRERLGPAPRGSAHAPWLPLAALRTRGRSEPPRTCARLDAATFFFLLALWLPELPPLCEGLAGLFLLFRATPGVDVAATRGI